MVVNDSRAVDSKYSRSRKDATSYGSIQEQSVFLANPWGSKSIPVVDYMYTKMYLFFIASCIDRRGIELLTITSTRDVMLWQQP